MVQEGRLRVKAGEIYGFGRRIEGNLSTIGYM